MFGLMNSRTRTSAGSNVLLTAYRLTTCEASEKRRGESEIATRMARSRAVGLIGENCAALLALASGAEEAEFADTAQYLLYLCGCPLAGVVEHALETLLQWTAAGDARVLLAQKGAVEALVPLLAAEDGRQGAAATRVATAVIEKIALEGDAKVLEALEVAVGPLVDLVGLRATLHAAKHARAIVNAAAALRNMARQPSMRALIDSTRRSASCATVGESKTGCSTWSGALKGSGPIRSGSWTTGRLVIIVVPPTRRNASAVARGPRGIFKYRLKGETRWGGRRVGPGMPTACSGALDQLPRQRPPGRPRRVIGRAP